MTSFGTGAGIALDDGLRQWSFDALNAEVAALAARLTSQRTRVFATVLDNSAAWIVADLAAGVAGIVHVPLPVFFTPGQLAHALQAAGVDAVLAPAAIAAGWTGAPSSKCVVARQALAMIRLPHAAAQIPAGTSKITFTSGTTGTPKGVCLSGQALDRVADGLVTALRPLEIRRHLCALPFAVLLENIAGVMAPLRSGATCLVRPLTQLGLSGSSSFDAARFHALAAAEQPHSVIVLPQMLRAWVAYLMQSGQRAPESLRLVAVGGAAVGRQLVLAARGVGIPAHEGYGLSEGASVQTLNLPGADRPGSAGRALPHARLRIAADGEVEISGSLFSGYLGSTQETAEWLPTGDLGALDGDGFLHIEGRKKHVLITAYGRNVSPEWVETALCAESSVAQAVVFGDGEPALSAVLWPVRPDVDDASLQTAVAAANSALPDYAQIGHWVRGRADFSAASGLATTNGRPQRAAIHQLHADALLPAAIPH